VLAAAGHPAADRDLATDVGAVSSPHMSVRMGFGVSVSVTGSLPQVVDEVVDSDSFWSPLARVAEVANGDLAGRPRRRRR
jgi:hypothetical protein